MNDELVDFGMIHSPEEAALCMEQGVVGSASLADTADVTPQTAIFLSVLGESWTTPPSVLASVHPFCRGHLHSFLPICSSSTAVSPSLSYT